MKNIKIFCMFHFCLHKNITFHEVKAFHEVKHFPKESISRKKRFFFV